MHLVSSGSGSEAGAASSALRVHGGKHWSTPCNIAALVHAWRCSCRATACSLKHKHYVSSLTACCAMLGVLLHHHDPPPQHSPALQQPLQPGPPDSLFIASW
jgi:hypothetical protein